MRRQDKPKKEPTKPKEKVEPKLSPSDNKEKLQAEIRRKFQLAFGYEDK